MSEELKPCPFCGGEVELRHDHTTEDIDTVHHAQPAPDCPLDAGVSAFLIGNKELVAAWNRRAALKDRDVVLEEAAERAAFVAGYRAAHMVPDAYDSTSAAEEAWEGYWLVSRNLKERV